MANLVFRDVFPGPSAPPAAPSAPSAIENMVKMPEGFWDLLVAVLCAVVALCVGIAGLSLFLWWRKGKKAERADVWGSR